MTSPLLSVVIPTRNRMEYAVHCVRTLTRLPCPNLEIVIQDNSDTPELSHALAGVGDARIRHEHRAGSLSVIENCSLGIARARGEYVSLLGDDDGVAPALIEAAAWAAESGVDAITPSRAAWYVWPDVRFKHGGAAGAATLTIRPYTGRVTERDPAAGVRRSLHAAFQDLVDTVALPKLYYGIVHRRCLAAVQAEAGSVFPGVSPDLSAAIAISKHVRRFVSVDFPIFLPGSSARSTAGAHARKEHVGRLEDQPHLPRGCETNWPIEVPAVFTVQTVWAQSGLAALRATDRSQLARELDLGLLHAMCGTLNRGYWPVVARNYWRAVDAAGQSRIRGAAALTSGILRTWALRCRYLAGRLTRSPWYVGEHSQSGLATVADAAAALDRWIEHRGVALQLQNESQASQLRN